MLHGFAGPALVVDGTGAPTLGMHGPNGLPRSLAIDFAGGGFPGVPAEAGSADGPFFPALGYLCGLKSEARVPEFSTPARQRLPSREIRIERYLRLFPTVSRRCPVLSNHTSVSPGDGGLKTIVPRRATDRAAAPVGSK